MIFEEFIENQRTSTPESNNRPFLHLDLGKQDSVKVFYPPREHVGQTIEFSGLVSIMKDYHTIPLRVNSEHMFVGWREARLFFGTLLDQFLVDEYDIFPTDVRGG